MPNLGVKLSHFPLRHNILVDAPDANLFYIEYFLYLNLREKQVNDTVENYAFLDSDYMAPTFEVQFNSFITTRDVTNIE